MKEFKTFNQQLTILRNRGMIVPSDGRPKRFLEQENYYNVRLVLYNKNGGAYAGRIK